MNKKLIGFTILIVSLLLGVATVSAAYPVSERGISPTFHNDGPGGNVECSEVGVYEFASERFDEGAQFGGTVGPITWSTTDQKFVSWTGVHGGLAVIVKGGPGAHVYTYDASYEWDNLLASPLNPGGQIPDLSNITFCWNPPVVDEGQWCSPGYWRQPQHLASWGPTGYLTSDLFSAALGYSVTRSNKGVRDGATTNPTLLFVLENPQFYGGDDFNAVGDLLSAAHPDVNFTGERVEDSCPLS
jgi:hypothetical protein